MATAAAHLTAGSATSTPVIMKASSAAVPMHPAAPARPTDPYRVPRMATASRTATAASARPGTILAGTGTGQLHARPVTSTTAQHNPTAGPVASSRLAARRPGCARANAATITAGEPNSATAAAAASSGGKSRHRYRCQVSSSPSASSSTTGPGSCPDSVSRYRSSVADLIGSNATLTLPCRQYSRYPDPYM